MMASSGAGKGGGVSNGAGPIKLKHKKKTKDGKITSKSPKKSKSSQPIAPALDIENELDDLDQEFNVRVRERGPDSPTEGRPRSRLGALLRDPSPSAIKESIKRPLSGLLKRPGSRATSRERKGSRDLGAGGDDSDLMDDTGTIAESANIRPSSGTTKKKGLFGGSGNSDKRPGTAFGRRFSFGRKGKGKKGDLVDADDLEDELDATESPVNVRRKGIVEIPDSDPKQGRDSPDIPTLEEVEGAAYGGLQVADAPSIAVNRVATYRELDGELMKHAAFARLEDIDLSLLTKFLCPESEVRDEDAPWSWDYLYTTIASDLRSEWEDGEEEEGDENVESVAGPTPIRGMSGKRNSSAASVSQSKSASKIGLF